MYTTRDLFRTARSWRIVEAGVKSDHSMTLVDLVCAKMPETGKGRPVFPTHLLKDKSLTKKMKERGIQALSEVRSARAAGARSDEKNPQTILADLKRDWMRMARTRERETVPKLLREIRMLEDEILTISKRTGISDKDRMAETHALTVQVRRLQEKRATQLKSNSRAKHRLEGERPTKYWVKLHREIKPRDTMYALEKPGVLHPDGTPEFEEDSTRMADLARDYHANLQKDEPNARPPEIREEDIQQALSAIEVRLTESQREEMGGPITYDDCELALRFSKTSSSPGMDGITYEVWKALHARFIEDSEHPS